jgi:uncharacterized repeat protein (TIGR01451 family)
MRSCRHLLQVSVFVCLVLGFSTTVLAQSAADLQVVKTDSPDPVASGGLITYTITITNNGPGTVAAPFVIDTFQTGTTEVSNSFSPPQSSSLFCSGSTFPGGSDFGCDIDPLAAGQSVVWTIIARTTLPPGSTVTNLVTVNGAGNQDPIPGNNVDIELTAVAAGAAVPTLSEWGLALLAAALAMFAAVRVKIG